MNIFADDLFLLIRVIYFTPELGPEAGTVDATI